MSACHLYRYATFFVAQKRNVFHVLLHKLCLCHSLLSPSLRRCESSTSSRLREDRKTPKRGLFLFCQVMSTMHHSMHTTLTSRHINVGCIWESKRRRPSEDNPFAITPTRPIAWPTALHCFVNWPTPSRPNQFGVGHFSRRQAERDLSSLIKTQSRGESVC